MDKFTVCCVIHAFCELALVLKIDIKERVFAASGYQGKIRTISLIAANGLFFLIYFIFEFIVIQYILKLWNGMNLC